MEKPFAVSCWGNDSCERPDMDEKEIQLYPNDRTYRLDIKRCLMTKCDGELAELSYYERNNWVTVELQCNKCRKRFVVKVEV